MRTVAVFFVLNFTILSSIVYLLLRYFVMQQGRVSGRPVDAQQRVLREAQRQIGAAAQHHSAAADREAAEARARRISDGFADVTVMFADIVNFTAFAEEKYSPRKWWLSRRRCSAASTIWPRSTAWTRSRPSAMRTWSRAGCPAKARSTSMRS